MALNRFGPAPPSTPMTGLSQSESNIASCFCSAGRASRRAFRIASGTPSESGLGSSSSLGQNVSQIWSRAWR